MKIFDYSEEHGRDDRLAWDVLLAPHHCSKNVMYTGRRAAAGRPGRVRPARARRRVIVASSDPVPGRNDPGDNPPHAMAKARYLQILDSAEQFICTQEWPDTRPAQPVVFALDDGGLDLLAPPEPREQESADAVRKHAAAPAVPAVSGAGILIALFAAAVAALGPGVVRWLAAAAHRRTGACARRRAGQGAAGGGISAGHQHAAAPAGGIRAAVTRPPAEELSEGQRLAAAQLDAIAARSDGAVEILTGPHRDGTGQHAVIDIALDCSGVPAAPGGLRLRAREAFSIGIGPQFPFTVPEVRVRHARWADSAHVQWQHVICLYAAPSVEWNPADGMRGLLDRLIEWLRQAAAANLDPDDQPLHPPVAYASLSAGVAVVHPDLPAGIRGGAPGAAELMVAVCRQDRVRRVDVTEWITPGDWKLRYQAAELNGTLGTDGYRILGAAAVILGRDAGFEYPDEAPVLLTALEEAGADRDALLGLLTAVAGVNAKLDAAHLTPDGSLPARPLCLFVGTPSRRSAGQRRVHLVCWRVDDAGQQVLAAARQPGSSDEQLARTVTQWAGQAPVTWVPVMEARSEVTCRRDAASSAAWLDGKRVLVLGCGALGAPAAEICVRAGAAGGHRRRQRHCPARHPGPAAVRRR